MANIKLKCVSCNTEFETQVKRYNYLKKKGRKQWFCSKICCINEFKSELIEKNCLFCNQSFLGTTKRQSTNFCSTKCSKKYANSFMDRKQISDSLKDYFKNNPKVKIKKEFKNQCIICNKFISLNKQRITCSTECFKTRCRETGKRSVSSQSNKRRSKNEIYFSELCKTEYNNILVNEPIFNGWDADVILPIQKIAILWNGKWHYEKITKKHSVQQVQNRDKIKLDEIKNLGYDSYIIKDLGSFDKKFVEDEFRKFQKWLCGRMIDAPSS